MNVESRKKKAKQRLRENKADYTMCFTMRNTLFHEEKHFVSVKETFCFTKGNTLFHKEKQSVSVKETLCKIYFAFFATYSVGLRTSREIIL